MNIRHGKGLTLLAAAFLVIIAPASAAPLMEPGRARPPVYDNKSIVNDKSPVRASAIDLRPRLRRLKFNEGSNLVFTSSQIKLFANSRGGKVVGWSATDPKGNSLPTVFSKTITCKVCVKVNTGGGGSTETCFEVDCDKLPEPTKLKSQ